MKSCDYLNKETTVTEEEEALNEASYQEVLNNDPEYTTWLNKLEQENEHQ